MDLKNDARYNFVIEQGIPNIEKIKKEYKNQLLLGIKEPKLKSKKFVSEYQGRIYKPGDANESAASLLKEYITVGYETYISDPDKLKKKDGLLYAYIRDCMRG